ncbi:gamma-glutamyl-gamma-aminobutyrate hydrolase family protein [Amylibacter marinus]|nr:gamma-glutamyl-gamma-aminobutyrate hydrolase family protein [Amylibacter marinus]
MPRPLVGVIGNAELIDDSYPVQMSGLNNLEALAEVSGAMPMIFPALPQVNDVDDICATFDGILLTGARPNVHPSEYNEAETPAHGKFDRNRDALALPLIRACVARGIPILGICRGFQEFNVAFGGSLYPEIRDLPGRMNHRMPPEGTLEEKFALRHNVSLIEDGEFAKIFGTNVVRTNSLHGQGIKQAGEGVIIEGTAPDGTPEAIRIADAPSFAMAVQWHPEWRAGFDSVSRPLFETFGAALRG